MIITTSSSNNGTPNPKHGPTLSASTLGFLGLSAIYPGGTEAFLGSAMNASRSTRILRIGTFTCIFALASNLLEEYRTQKNYFTGEDDSHALIHHHRPARVDDLWNPVAGAFISGLALQAKKRSILKALKCSGFFSVGMGIYSIGLDFLEPYYPLKSLDVVQSFTEYFHLMTTAGSRK
ncbi:hypothetical protein DSO57_1004618 [Entomophthora muscae]|uniref:Uncharacterized protein n=1 Tax=Entomophthora muscae TaxID=34485 RepID=A0ACC2SL38_9FUNG|nr:hypothetical protein DSO57_1004618 [Entomophthora muscae]